MITHRIIEISEEASRIFEEDDRERRFQKNLVPDEGGRAPAWKAQEEPDNGWTPRVGATGREGVDGRFLATGVVIPYVTRLLAAKGLVHKVRLEAHRGRLQGVLVKNQMDDAEMAAWKTIKDSFKATFGMEIEEKWTDKLSPTLAKFAAANQELDAELLGVTPGEMGYVTLKNGRKYFEGARLKSGPFIKDISRERLILAIGAVEEPYYLKKGKR